MTEHPEPDDLGEDEPILDELDAEESHRGALGEFGAESSGFVERTFRERIIAVGVITPETTKELIEQSLDELDLLIDTAGADVVDRVIVKRNRLDPAHFVGSGKVEELRVLSEMHDCDTVIFDHELSPGQQYNLEKALGRTAIGRPEVILDIFAQNAHSTEGKAQVELAQLQYRLPRLRGRGASLSQQAGRIGTRGPGETQLEVDRRRIERRIHKLKRDLTSISKIRHNQSKSRKRNELPTIAIVGYTNAGKSTLMNRLTDAGVLVEDRLFATLDDTTRRLLLPTSGPALLADTVGFIRKLPHGLVEAFKSTLEVAVQADLLLHLVDASAAEPDHNIAVVRDVLDEIGAGEVPHVLVFNKSDRIESQTLVKLLRDHENSLAVSAVTGEGVAALIDRLDREVLPPSITVRLRVPHDRGDVLADLHRVGEILTQEHDADGTVVTARIPKTRSTQFDAFASAAIGGV